MMEINKHFKNRKFKLWDYSPTHSRILIRSLSTKDSPFNLDIIFMDTKFSIMAPSSVMENFSFEEPSKSDFKIIKEVYKKDIEEKQKLFVINASSTRSYIIAWRVILIQNELSIFHSSIQDIDLDTIDYKTIDVISS